uniref:acyl carrier protein n=1 Tax=Flavobacterium sp. H122 TaxID=2529860 RepID=UPI00145B725D
LEKNAVGFHNNKYQSKSISKKEKQPAVLTKEQIASILSSELCGLLYLDKEELDGDKAFSELGLDSILGVELIKIINKNFTIDLKASKLYDYPSIGQLSDYLQRLLSDLPGQREVGFNGLQQHNIISPIQRNSGKMELTPLEDFEQVSRVTEVNIQPISLL